MVSLALLLSLLGCNDYLVAGIEKRQPDILVFPSHIDFGHLESGEETGADSFIVVNTGDEDLIISSPDLVSGNASRRTRSFVANLAPGTAAA